MIFSEPKLKICIVSREYPPETLWGGIGTFTYNLAHGLKNIGHTVDVVSFTLGNESRLEDEGIIVHRIGSPKIPFTGRTWWHFTKYSLFPFSFLYSYKVMKKIALLSKERRYDIIDFPEHIGEGFFSIFFRRWPSLVRLYTPLSLIGEIGLRRSTNFLDYYLLGLIEKYSIKNSTIVNSPSRNLASLVSDKFKCHRDIQIIYNPIDTEKFAPMKTRSEKNSKAINVLFAGRLEDRKGAHVLAHAIPYVINAVESVKFTFLGKDCLGIDGVPSMKDYIVDVLQEKGGLNNVMFFDPVPYHELVKHYSAADIMVVPSLYDNSPYTCLEAMSCGVPVIGTSAGGMPEYIDNGKSGIIVPPADAESLARAILELVVDPEKRTRYGLAARHKVLVMFKREMIAQEITKLYNRANSEFFSLQNANR
jgi:glycosyltransferase involved in cell wall biosynthesis